MRSVGLVVVVVVALVALVACAGPKRDVDSVLAAHRSHDRTIEAPLDRTPLPWRVGQWVLHKVAVGGELAYVRHAIVEQNARPAVDGDRSCDQTPSRNTGSKGACAQRRAG